MATSRRLWRGSNSTRRSEPLRSARVADLDGECAAGTSREVVQYFANAAARLTGSVAAFWCQRGSLSLPYRPLDLQKVSQFGRMLGIAISSGLPSAIHAVYRLSISGAIRS